MLTILFLLYCAIAFPYSPDLMNRQQRQGTDILFTDLPAGPKSCKDHFIKLLSGQMAYRIIIQFYCADAFCAACHG